MRLRSLSPGTRIVVLTLAALMLVALLALPSFAAHRTQFIHTKQWFESATSECASGTFEASGNFTATGDARSCARHFRAPSIVKGTTQLHNSDRLRIDWKIQCKDPDGTARRFECKGQWQVDGPNWTGWGNTRAVLNFLDGPFGSVDFTFNGKLNPR